MEKNTSQIFIEKLNTGSEFLLKNDSEFKKLILEVSHSTIESLAEILRSLEKSDYISLVTKVVIKFKLGKIKNFKSDLNNICHELFRQKKYARIKQIKEILELLGLHISEYNDYEDKVSMRMRASSFKKYHLDSEFNDVVNNSNLYLASETNKILFFQRAEIYPLEKFLEAIFKSLTGSLDSSKFINSLVYLYNSSGEEKLKRVIEEIYRDKKLPLSRVKKYKSESSSRDVKDVKKTKELETSMFKENINEIKQIIFERKIELYSEDLNRAQFLYIIQELIFCYEKLNEDESVKKLKDYLILKTRFLNE